MANDNLPTKATTRPEIVRGPKGFAIRNLPELWRMAEIMVKGGIAPKGMTPEGACAVMAFGMELGYSPIQSLRDICFINGRPSAYGDAVSAKINGSGLLGAAPEILYTGSGEDRTCTVALKRRGLPGEFRRSYSMRQAKAANLLGKDNWRMYAERMLYWRAYSMAARDGFSDILKGLTTREEAMDLPPITVEVISSRTVPDVQPVPTALEAPARETPFDGLEKELAAAAPPPPPEEAPPTEEPLPEESASAPVPSPAPCPAAKPAPANGDPASPWAQWNHLRANLRAEDLVACKGAAGTEYLTPKTSADQLLRAVAKANEILKE